MECKYLYFYTDQMHTCVFYMKYHIYFLLKVALTEMLIDAENIEYPDAPVNPYRKLLGMKPLQPLCL